MNNINQVQLWE